MLYFKKNVCVIKLSPCDLFKKCIVFLIKLGAHILLKNVCLIKSIFFQSDWETLCSQDSPEDTRRPSVSTLSEVKLNFSHIFRIEKFHFKMLAVSYMNKHKIVIAGTLL